MPHALTWKDALQGQLPPDLEAEVNIYDTQIELRRQGKIDERVFAETRLRRGVYGQRYDNGQRHDGVSVQQLSYPSGELTKGPQTLSGIRPGCSASKFRLGA